MQFTRALTTSFLTGVAAAALLAACLAEQAATPPPSYQFSATGAALGVPIEIVADGLVLVQAKVNDHPGWFIVDNAVQGFVADRDYARRISLEESGKRILLAPNRTYGDAAAYDQSGLRIRAGGPSFHEFAVGRVLPASPAAEAGIEPGDIIESLDRKSANEMTLTELRNLLTQPNARYSVGIRRGKSRLRINLQLRPLL